MLFRHKHKLKQRVSRRVEVSDRGLSGAPGGGVNPLLGGFGLGLAGHGGWGGCTGLLLLCGCRDVGELLHVLVCSQTSLGL